MLTKDAFLKFILPAIVLVLVGIGIATKKGLINAEIPMMDNTDKRTDPWPLNPDVCEIPEVKK